MGMTELHHLTAATSLKSLWVHGICVRCPALRTLKASVGLSLGKDESATNKQNALCRGMCVFTTELHFRYFAGISITLNIEEELQSKTCQMQMFLKKKMCSSFWKLSLHHLPSGYTVSHMQRFTVRHILPPSPLQLEARATSKLLLHSHCKWNIILACYGKAESAVYLTAQERQAGSLTVYENMTRDFFFFVSVPRRWWVCGLLTDVNDTSLCPQTANIIWDQHVCEAVAFPSHSCCHQSIKK